MKMTFNNLHLPKYSLWIIPFAPMVACMLMMGCTQHELIDLPSGNVAGSIVFKDIDYKNYLFPDGPFQIKARCDTNVYWVLPDANGDFSFTNLPKGGYSFTLTDDDKEIMSIDHCSFLGGGEPAGLNFFFRIQPDIKSIDYHFEIIEDTLWMLGQLETDGIPVIESNTIMLFLSHPPDTTRFLSRVIDFDWKTRQIKYMLSEAYDEESGFYINSYIYKKYREYGVEFTNYVLKQDHFMESYREFRSSFLTRSDSTTIYRFTFPGK